MILDRNKWTSSEALRLHPKNKIKKEASLFMPINTHLKLRDNNPLEKVLDDSALYPDL